MTDASVARFLHRTRHASLRSTAGGIQRPPIVVFAESTLREAADQMVREQVGRLPVVSPEDPLRVIDIITRSDLLAAYAPRLRALAGRAEPRWRRTTNDAVAR